ncbi:MAG: hypothetical protein ACT4QG_01175 [Sporichthyaceae bacterium]
MALVDLAPRFHTAVRGYDRVAVDAVIRAEAEHLDRLNSRIQLLEQALAEVRQADPAESVDRAAQFRDDDPERRRAMRAAADMLVEAWDHARQIVLAEDATAHLQREHATSIAHATLADVTVRAQAEEQRAQQTADSWVAAAAAEAAAILAHAEDFVADAHPMAQRILAEAAEESQELAHHAESALLAARDALDADLMRRQTAVEYGLQESLKLAERLQAETAAMNAEVGRVQQQTLAQAHAVAAETLGALDLELARLEAEADQAMAELADHMAAMSTQVTVARESMAARAARAKAAAPAPQAPVAAPAAPRPLPPAVLPAFPPQSVQVGPPPAPEAEAAPAKAPKARAPRTPAAPKAPRAAKAAAPAEAAPAEAAARITPAAPARPTIKIAAAAPSIIRL